MGMPSDPQSLAKLFRIPAEPSAMDSAQKRSAALQMKQAGLDYETIGLVIGMSGPEVRRMVMRDLRRIGMYLSRQAKAMFGLEAARLEALQAALWPAAMQGNTRAVEVSLQILKRRAEMFGLDAARKVETRNESKVISFDLADLTPAELESRLASLPPALPSSPPPAGHLPGLSPPAFETTQEGVFDVVHDHSGSPGTGASTPPPPAEPPS